MSTPVVFIHGLWLHADSWKPWLELFRAAGYDPIAPGWPGEPATVAEANAHPERLANVGIDDVVVGPACGRGGERDEGDGGERAPQDIVPA